jgi:hypothetical protein
MTVSTRLLWALPLCLLAQPPALAQDGSQNVKIVRAAGEGADASKALAAALVEAIRQVNGLEVKEDRAETKGFREAVSSFGARFSELVAKGGAASQPAGDAQGEEKTFAIANLASKGLVQRYKILSEEKKGDAFRVEVEATVRHYDPEQPWGIGLPTLLTVAGNQPQMDVSSTQKGLDGQALADALATQVALYIDSMSRFQRVDMALVKRVLGSVRNELKGAESARLLELGRNLDIHRMLFVDLDEVQVRVDRTTAGGADVAIHHKFDARLRGRVRMVDTTAGRTTQMWELPFESRTPVGKADGEPDPQLGRQLCIQLATEIATDVAWRVREEQMVPVKVSHWRAPASAEERARVILNLGAPLVRVGMEFVLFEPGEAITDPETGKPLGTLPGADLGRVRVIKAEAKMAIAEVLEQTGGKEPIKVGTPCKRVLTPR